MKDMYYVRKVVEGDLSAALDVLAENVSRPPCQPSASPSEITNYQRSMWHRMMATDDLTVYLAETDGEVVGIICLLVLPNLSYGCRPTAFIEPVVVKYAHRRRGVARLMLERALHDAQAASCFKVQLLSHKRHANDGAHELYRSVGFESEAEGFRTYLDG